VLLVPQGKEGFNTGDLVKFPNGSVDVVTYDKSPYSGSPTENGMIAQFMHFTTKDPILKDDYFIWVWEERPDLHHRIAKSDYVFAFNAKHKLKVVASTDESLNLPSIPPNWIHDVFCFRHGTVTRVNIEGKWTNVKRATLPGLDPKDFMFMADWDLPPVLSADIKVNTTTDNNVIIKI